MELGLIISMTISGAMRNLRLYGPIVITALLIAIADKYRLSPHFTLAPLFVALASGIYSGGIVSGVIIGLMMSAYGVHSLFDVSLIRAAIIAVSTGIIVVQFGVLKKKVDNTDTILHRLRDVDIHLTGTIARWPNLSEAEKKQAVAQSQHKIANILTLTIGWLSLAKQQDKVQRDYDKAG